MWTKLESNRVILPYGGILTLLLTQLNITNVSEFFIKRTRYDLFNETYLKQMEYDKGSSGWYLKAAKNTHAPPAFAAASASASASAFAPVSTAAQSFSTQELGSSLEAPSWFFSFQQDFSSFSSKVRTRLQNIKEKITSLDKWVTHMEKYHAKSSKSSDPMDISSASQSGDDNTSDDDDDVSTEKEGNSEDEGDEGNNEEEGTQDEGEEEEKGDGSEEED
ncbi:uncharacterized protein LOC131164894 [Malania oleifera]|uniref:uncharacterized protein LOC131164894 n=1 Tax=Malania oleifera TaxID=397392 RepID=UPI0025AE34E8|nr:uncharacterized protein LOC131164894 [Malania oleifera]